MSNKPLIGIPPQLSGENHGSGLSRSISCSLTREQLAVAVLSYVEKNLNIVIPVNDIAYDLVCHTSDDGQIERVEAVFKAKPAPSRIIRSDA